MSRMTDYTQKRMWRWAFAIALACGLTAAPWAWAQIGISGLSMDVAVAPGGTFTGYFTVINKSPQPREFTVELRDYDRDIHGDLVVLPAGTHPRSLAKFIVAVVPSTFTLRPEQRQQINFSIKIPATERGPHWGAIAVSSPLPPSQPPQQGSISVTSEEQFLFRIRQTDPTNAVNKGRVTGMQVLLPDQSKPLRVLIDYENSGTTFQELKGEVRIINAKGDIVVKVAIKPIPVLPGGKLRLEIPIEQKLPSGNYVAVAVLDFGGDALLGAQARFKIP